ncbi:hypothetical protein IQ06DRAFT_54914 [Phaeosphaeriaceae sp. SRC1lsM3a]|nr:hypothetical protein IQ06DRAFT_54914 [Stagonospora sp. SRC1lsM3a]
MFSLYNTSTFELLTFLQWGSDSVRLEIVFFLRSDTKTGHSVRPETTSTRSCPGEHHLLLNHHDAIVSPSAQWATRSQRTADDSLMKFMVHSVRLRWQPSSWIRDVWPSSRFDEEDQIYFVSDKDDKMNNWGIINIWVKPDTGLSVATSPIHCVVFF